MNGAYFGPFRQALASALYSSMDSSELRDELQKFWFDIEQRRGYPAVTL